MPHARAIITRPLLFVGLLVTTMFASAGVAQAAGFGEITRFGGPGTGPGQLTPSVLGPNHVTPEFAPWHVIGVETSTNDVFVLEETKKPEENAKFEETRFFRLQKLSSTGAFLGEKAFSYKSPKAFENDEETDTVDGIAVDQAKGRLYFLVNQARPEEARDENASVAARLYAFKTTPNASKQLEGASGANAEGVEGLLAGAEVLTPMAKGPYESLLQPHGITVDPSTHEITILAHIGKCELEEPGKPQSEEHECEDELGNPDEEPHFVAQRITETGALGKRFVDTQDSLNPTEELAPQSPVITGSGAGEQLLAAQSQRVEASSIGAIDQFPANFEETKAAIRLLPDAGGLEASEPGRVEEVGEEGSDNIGGTMVASADGKTLYGLTSIKNEETEGKPESAFGVFERSAETLAPIGWTGGQQSTNSGGTDKCVLQPGVDEGEHVQIAAGGEGKIFVLVPEYLRNPGAGAAFPTKDAIIEFGEGGEGCPAASTKEIAVAVGGVEKVTTPIPVGKPATFSSSIKQGDALSVTWEVEKEGVGKPTFTEVQTSDQFQAPKVKYTFTAAGKYKVSEKVKTDNLETPELTVARTVTATELTEAPKLVTQPRDAAVPTGSTAKFIAAASGKPTPTAQWYVSTDGGKTFAKDEKAVTGDVGTLGNTLEVTATKAKSGYEYYVEYTNSVEGVKSAVATLTVTSAAPAITSSPSSVAVTEGENASFAASATGAPAPTVQWELSTDGGGTWASIGGANSTTYTVFGATTGQSGYEYRATFVNEVGLPQTTSPATLTVSAPPVRAPEQITPPVTITTPPPPPPPTPVTPGVAVGGTSFSVATSGAFAVQLSCPARATCAGTITLRTLTAVSANASTAKVKKAILVLASGSFSLTGGQTKTVTLHLVVKGRKLLAVTHAIRARVTVLARSATGLQATTTRVVVLRLAKRKH